MMFLPHTETRCACSSVFFFLLFLGRGSVAVWYELNAQMALKGGREGGPSKRGWMGWGANDELNIKIISTVVGQGQGSITQSNNNNNNMYTHTERDVFIPF